MRGFLRNIRTSIALVPLLCLSCTAITHVDEFEVAQDESEVIPPEIAQCMREDFNFSLSEQCAYCRCTSCETEIRDCGSRCREIVACAILKRCDQSDSSACVAEKCGVLLVGQPAGVDQATALAVCFTSCNDVCLTR